MRYTSPPSWHCPGVLRQTLNHLLSWQLTAEQYARAPFEAVLSVADLSTFTLLAIEGDEGSGDDEQDLGGLEDILEEAILGEDDDDEEDDEGGEGDEGRDAEEVIEGGDSEDGEVFGRGSGSGGARGGDGGEGGNDSVAGEASAVGGNEGGTDPGGTAAGSTAADPPGATAAEAPMLSLSLGGSGAGGASRWDAGSARGSARGPRRGGSARGGRGGGSMFGGSTAFSFMGGSEGAEVSPLPPPTRSCALSLSL